jgi:tetratricopeptide (TPR) repeat protein
MAPDETDPSTEDTEDTVRRPEGAPPPSGPLDFEELPRGAALGRYLVVDRIGRGGMGVVYSAYDPELDRRVALKLLKGSVDGEAGTRFLREAQAMARLSHPGVITVHDVGTLGGRVFIAMELVDGTTLRGWLAQQRRRWREVVDVYVAAGRGLAAAHAAGIIHRDFKPDNVLVSRDGRARVTDFGLARFSAEAGPPSSASLWDEPASGPLVTPLTAAGLVMGTPGYMAPEQCTGLPVDARTDQFSFCISLYEGLYGARPFAQGSMQEFLSAVAAARTLPPPPDVQVPAWLRRLILRGLRSNPAERYPSMEALLSELERDPEAIRRRRLGLAGGALAIAAVVGATMVGASQQRSLCRGAERRLAGAWDEPIRAEVRRAFASSGLPYAGQAFEGTARALDAYASGWAGMAQEACEAARIRGEQSDELYSRRTVCLEQRLQELSALTALFVKADGQIVERAVAAAQRLEPLARCADSGALLAAVPPPGEEIRPRVEAVRAQVAKARALLEAGAFDQGLPAAREAVEAARATGYRPAEAEALLQLGTMEYRYGDARAAEATLHRAVVAADAARDDAIRGLALARLGDAVGVVQGRLSEGAPRLDEGAAVLERMGPGAERDLLEARLRTNIGRLREREERFQDQQAEFERALELTRAVLGEESLETARAESNLGAALFFQGRADQALAHYRRALEITERAQGPGHPDLGIFLTNIGQAHAERGEHDLAVAAFRRARQIYEAVFGADHAALAKPLVGEGHSEVALGHDEPGLEALRRALEIRQKQLGADHPEVADTLFDLGAALGDMRRLREAAALGQRATDLYERALGKDHPAVATSLDLLSEVLIEQGQLQEARAAVERAYAIRLKAFGAEGPLLAASHINFGDLARAEKRLEKAAASYRRALDLMEKAAVLDHAGNANALAGLGAVELARGAPERAIPHLERALRIREAHPSGSPRRTAEVSLALAQALWRNGELDRARATAEKAQRMFQQVSDERAQGATSLLETLSSQTVR